MISSKKKNKSFYKRHRDGILAFALLGIPVLWWLALSAFPLAFGIGLGFCEWTNVYESPVFVGLKNFAEFFKNEYYWMSLVRTLYIGGLCFAVQMALGLALAAALNKITFLKVFSVPCGIFP